MRKLIVAAVVVIAPVGVAAWQFQRPNPDALWQIVHGRCVPAAEQGLPAAPCTQVDLPGHYAVLKDLAGVGQYLLIPTDRLAGIESPELLDGAEPNYWRDAWEARRFLVEAVHAPLERQDIGLAINSASGRSQEQLHIHIDCMRPEVVASLKAWQAGIGPRWSELPNPLGGHGYRAMLLTDGDLRDTDPFKLLYDDIRWRGDAMADQTLLLTGTTLADGRPGFILLNDEVGWDDNASAEELMDHRCSLADQRRPQS
jgi:CDP-diacylglycerol pyrophosphatase